MADGRDDERVEGISIGKFLRLCTREGVGWFPTPHAARKIEGNDLYARKIRRENREKIGGGDALGMVICLLRKTIGFGIYFKMLKRVEYMKNLRARKFHAKQMTVIISFEIR